MKKLSAFIISYILFKSIYATGFANNSNPVAVANGFLGLIDLIIGLGLSVGFLGLLKGLIKGDHIGSKLVMYLVAVAVYLVVRFAFFV